MPEKMVGFASPHPRRFASPPSPRGRSRNRCVAYHSPRFLHGRRWQRYDGIHKVGCTWRYGGQGQALPLQKQRMIRGIHATSCATPVGAAPRGCPIDGHLTQTYGHANLPITGRSQQNPTVSSHPLDCTRPTQHPYAENPNATLISNDSAAVAHSTPALPNQKNVGNGKLRREGERTTPFIR